MRQKRGGTKGLGISVIKPDYEIATYASNVESGINTENFDFCMRLKDYSLKEVHIGGVPESELFWINN